MTSPTPTSRTPGALLLALVVVALPSLSLLGSGLFDTIYTTVDASWRTVTVVEGNTARDVQLLGSAVILVMAAHVLLTELRGGRRMEPLLPLTALTIAASTVASGGLELSEMLSLVVAVAAVLAASIVRIDAATMRAIAWYALFFCLSNWLYWAAGRPMAAKECRADKCGFLGVMLQGYTQHEQTLGLFAATLTPTLAYLPRRARVPAVLLVGLTVAATGSRTALAAFVLALLAGWLLSLPTDRTNEDPWTVHRGGRWLHQLLAAAPLVALTGASALFLTLPPDALTGRGQVWAVVREGLWERPLFGPGRDVIERGYATGSLDFVAHTEHSQAGYLVAAGGFVALGLMAAVLLTWTSRALRGTVAPMLLALAPALSFATEVTWSMSAFSSTFWTLFLVAALQSTIRGADVGAGPQEVVPLLRRALPVLLTGVVVGAAAGAAKGVSDPPTYRAGASIFLSARTQGAWDLYESSLVSQELTRSYARAVASPWVVAPALHELGREDDPDEVAARVETEVTYASVVLRLRVTDHDPEAARALADALGRQGTRLLPTLHAAPGDEAPVRATYLGASSPAPQSTLDRAMPVAARGASLGLILAAVLLLCLPARRRVGSPQAPDLGKLRPGEGPTMMEATTGSGPP